MSGIGRPTNAGEQVAIRLFGKLGEFIKSNELEFGTLVAVHVVSPVQVAEHESRAGREVPGVLVGRPLGVTGEPAFMLRFGHAAAPSARTGRREIA